MCPGCSLAPCGSCPTCATRTETEARTRGQATDPDLRVCSGVRNWCTSWPPRSGSVAGSDRSQSSVDSSTTTTTDNLAVAVAEVTDGFQTFQEIIIKLQLAIRQEGGGPWPGFPHLTQELLQESLEALENTHSELLRRAETKAREIERTADLEEEDLDYSTGVTPGGTPPGPTNFFPRQHQSRVHQPPQEEQEEEAHQDTDEDRRNYLTGTMELATDRLRTQQEMLRPGFPETTGRVEGSFRGSNHTPASRHSLMIPPTSSTGRHRHRSEDWTSRHRTSQES